MIYGNKKWLICTKVCPKSWLFLNFSQFYELAFLTTCCSFKQESTFVLVSRFLADVFSQFCQVLLEM